MAALGISLVTTAGLTYAFAATNGLSSAVAAKPAHVLGPAQGEAGPTALSLPASTTEGAAPTTVPPTPATGPTTATPTTVRQATTVNGGVYSNQYGNVQVQVRIGSDGALARVDTVQVPNGRDRSVEINNYAAPILNSEALRAQSAAVHSVSGATYTSEDYKLSLQSAIDAARADGITK